jgi:RNA polymerase sigma-70 factor, ECF subfamily
VGEVDGSGRPAASGRPGASGDTASRDAASGDAALLARIAGGDEDALEEVYARFGGAMRAVALRVTRTDRTAEEVVQDALLAVWRDPARFDPTRGSLGPWLLTLTRYKAIDAVRRETVVRRHTAEVDLELREAPDDVHAEAWLGIRRQRLGEAIARLPDDQRRALQLAFLGGLTHVEVAEREGIPLGTAKTRIRTALLKLREDLAPSIGPDGPGGPVDRRGPGAGTTSLGAVGRLPRPGHQSAGLT